MIGGAEIFKETIDRVDGIYLTLVKAHYEGDAFYPEIPSSFKEVAKTISSGNPRLEFITYER